MQYSFVKACLLALAASTSVLAQIAGFNVITAPTSGEVLVPGTTYTIKWTPSEPAGPVSILLLQGASNTTLQLGATIAAGIQSSLGKFDWAIPSDAGSFAAYGLKLQLDSAPTTFQFSNPFVIRGAAGTTKTVQLSQISTLASTSTSSSSSSTIASTSTSTSAPVTTSSTSTSAPPSSTLTSSTVVPYHNSTTLVSTTVAPSTVTPSASASASPTVAKTGGAVSNAVRGTGLLGALAVSLFMLL